MERFFRLLLVFASSIFLFACASSQRSPVEVFDGDGALLERTTFDENGEMATHWFLADDSTAVFEFFEDGKRHADTLMTEALRTYGVIAPERTFVDGVRNVSRHVADGANAVSSGVKTIAEKASPGAQDFSGWLVEKTARYVGEGAAESLENGLEKTGDLVMAGVAALPSDVDSLAIFAILAGYTRGVSVGFQETREFIEGIPDVAKKVAGADYGALLQKARDQAIMAEAFAVRNANMDSLSHLAGVGKEKLAELPDYMKGEFERIVEEFANEADSNFVKLGIDRKYRDEYIGAFVSGWVTWQFVVADLTYGAVRLVGIGARSAKASKLSARSDRIKAYEQKVALEDRKFLMPRDGHGGHWNEKKTLWKSEIPEVNAITHGRGIRFTGKEPNKMPDFSDWSRGTYKIAGLTGKNEEDFPKLYAKIAAKKNVSVSDAERWVKQNGLTPHHLSCNEMMLVPTALHDNVAHTGAASMIRNGNCR